MPNGFYIEVPPTHERDLPEFTYNVVPPTDGEGRLVPEALVEADGDYSALLKDDLLALVAQRNTGRVDTDLLPTDGTKADLVAALVADDNNTTTEES